MMKLVTLSIISEMLFSWTPLMEILLIGICWVVSIIHSCPSVDNSGWILVGSGRPWFLMI